MSTDTLTDAWYAANTDELDTEILNAIFSNHFFSLLEEEILAELQTDAEPELDDDFGDEYWTGSRFVRKPGDYYGTDFYC